MRVNPEEKFISIDAPESSLTEKDNLKKHIRWWEKKRVLFNLIIVGFSVFLMHEFWNYPMRAITGGSQIIFHAILFVIFANIAYTAGWIAELMVSYLFDWDGIGNFGRWVLFALGTLFTLVVADLFFVLEFDVLFA